MNAHIHQFFDFLKNKEGKNKPLKYKLFYEPKTITPEDLYVKGDLDLGNTSITFLPKNLKVDRNLDLHNTKITSLPEGLEVGGTLSLSGTGITSLPSDLKVGVYLGNLNLIETSIKTLPENLHVTGDLMLQGTPLDTLPHGLKVGGYLLLFRNNITSLPPDLEVGKGISLTQTPLAEKYTREEIRKMCPGIKGQIALGFSFKN